MGYEKKSSLVCENGLVLYTAWWYTVYGMRVEKTKKISKKELLKKYPILKFAGIVKGESSEVNNDKIDEFLYDIEQRK